MTSSFRNNDDLLSPEERSRSLQVFFWYTFALSIIILAYGIADVATSYDPPIAWTEVVIGTALATNALLLRWHKHLQVAKSILSTLLVVILYVIVPGGGTDGASSNWTVLFPIAIIIYMGAGLGLVFSVAVFLFTLYLAFGQLQGWFQTHYTIGWYQQLWVVMAASNFLGLTVERAQRRFRDTIVDQRERLRVLLSSLPAGVIMVDKDGKPLSWNDSAGVLLGKPVTTSVRADRFSEAFELRRENGTPYPSKALPLVLALTGSEGSMVNDVIVPRPDGGETVLRMAASPVKDPSGRLRGAVAVFEDATKEHEVDRMKSEFVSFASHQLKTPLTSIKWSVESLTNGDAGTLTPQQKEITDEIVGVTNGLARLVTDLLNVSRIETGRNFAVTLAPVDLRPIIDKVITDLASAATKRGVTVSDASLTPVLMRDADADKMHEVFMNLIGNAVKYSK
ncbi:MAG: hypothetical protein RLZZ324_966, partial [Candidatus Parcubacteria bacterium]